MNSLQPAWTSEADQHRNGLKFETNVKCVSLNESLFTTPFAEKYQKQIIKTKQGICTTQGYFTILRVKRLRIVIQTKLKRMGINKLIKGRIKPIA